MPRKLVKKCCMCGKPVFSIKSIYCRDCSHFSARMSDERFPPETREALWDCVRRDRGFFCFYTRQKLNVFDKSDPYFLEFDHFIPGDPSKIVTTSSWFNEMKGDLAIKEFKGSVVQLFNYWFKGIKIKKRKFRYWYRLMEDKAFKAKFEEGYKDFLISEKIAELRHKSRLTQEQLAKKINTTKSAISSYENSNYNGYSLPLLRKIAAACGAALQVSFVPKK